MSLARDLENIHCHPRFIIRDINSCRKGYSKGRLKSRESNHFKVQIETLETLVMRHPTTAARKCGFILNSDWYILI